MKNSDKQAQPLTRNLRDTLKSIVEKELDQLPEILAALPPEKKLDVLLKIMPFVLPKVASVEMTKGEPLDWDL
jgi:hypothetical protein